MLKIGKTLADYNKIVTKKINIRNKLMNPTEQVKSIHFNNFNSKNASKKDGECAPNLRNVKKGMKNSNYFLVLER